MGGFIAIYGVLMIAAGVLGFVLASAKNRDASAWAAWGFVLPPLIVLLVLMPTNSGPRPRRLTLDEEDALY